MKNPVKIELMFNETSRVTIFNRFIRIETCVYVRNTFADVLQKHNYQDDFYQLKQNKCGKWYLYHVCELPHSSFDDIEAEVNRSYCQTKRTELYLLTVYKSELRDAAFQKEYQSIINFKG